MSHAADRHRSRSGSIAFVLALALALTIVGVCHTAWAATTRVVVANSGDDTVTIFNLNTSAAITITDPCFVGPRSVAITDDGKFAGVTNAGADTVCWLDLTADPPGVLGATTVGDNPKGIAIKGSTALVAVNDPNVANNDYVVVIDISGLPTVPAGGTSVDLGGDTEPEGVAITSGGNFGLVVQTASQDVAYVDLSVPSLLVGTTTVGAGAFNAATTPDQTKALVTNSGDNTLSVIDITGLPTIPTAAEVSTLVIGDTPRGVAVTSDSTKAVVGQAGGDDEARIFTIPGFTPTTCSVGDDPFGVAISITLSGFRAAIANEGDGSVSVVDLSTCSVTDTVTVGTAPQGLAITPVHPPSANLKADPRNGKAPLTVNFDASSSTDPDGSIVSYQIDFGDGDSDTNSTGLFTHTYSTPGHYTAVVTVTDDDGATATAQQSVDADVNRLPVASLKATTPTKGKAPLTVTFDASGSTDVDGTIASYHFDFGDGGTLISSDPIVQHAYTAIGLFNASVVVVDNNGGQSDNSTRVTVEILANKPPVASLKATPVKGKAPLLVTFNASGSSDSDGTVVSYNFTFGDGGTLTTSNPRPTHTYAIGVFKACVVAIDDNGASSTPVCLTITGLANRPPTANFDRSQVQPYSTHTMQFTDLSKDADGQIVSRLWTFGDGGTSTAQNPSHTYAKAGTFTVTLTVTDNDGATGKKTANVGVK